jgi:hypothetical protein
MIITLSFRDAGGAREPGIQEHVRNMYMDSGFARFAIAPE